VLKKLLASVNIGSAYVDTILDKSTVRQGEMLKGEVHIKGGFAPQEINKIYLYLVTEVKYVDEWDQVQYKRDVWQEFEIENVGLIQPKEMKVSPFSYLISFLVHTNLKNGDFRHI
jgi:sporulation-control protein